MARTVAKKTAAPEPEVDLTDLLNKEPSAVNKAEAAWLVDCTGLEVTEEEMELVERVVHLVAGSAHRAWQKSEAAAEIHAEASERSAAAKAARASRKTDEDDDEAVEKPRRGRPRKAAVVEEDEEEEAVKPAPRRGRPAKAKAVEVEEEEEEPVKPRRGRPARKPAGSEAPF